MDMPAHLFHSDAQVSRVPQSDETFVRPIKIICQLEGNSLQPEKSDISWNINAFQATPPRRRREIPSIVIPAQLS